MTGNQRGFLGGDDSCDRLWSTGSSLPEDIEGQSGGGSSLLGVQGKDEAGERSVGETIHLQFEVL